VNLGCQDLKLLKFTFNAENFLYRLFRFIPSISSQFTLEMCVAAQSRKNFNKTPDFGGSSSFKVIDVDISKKVVASACYDKQHDYAYLQPFLC